MALPRSTADHYRRQQRLSAATVLATRRTWRGMGRDFDSSWSRIGRRLTLIVTAGQLGAARSSVEYLPEVLAETGQVDDPVGDVRPDAFAGVAGDGRDLESLLYGAVTKTKQKVGQDDDVEAALAAGEAWLDMAVQTALADAERAATGAGIASRPAVQGWVRMLNPPSCSRCVILAGKWFAWNQGFLRHPGCDCRHIPAPESMARDLRIDPDSYFGSLSEQEQDKTFTKAGAQAIRDGASVGAVVNARRGAIGLAPAGKRLTGEEIRILRGGRDRGRLQTTSVFGQDLFLTTEGTTVRGVAGKVLAERAGVTKSGDDRYRRSKAPRLMPESIYQIAGEDRSEAQRLLRLNGYIT